MTKNHYELTFGIILIFMLLFLIVQLKNQKNSRNQNFLNHCNSNIYTKFNESKKPNNYYKDPVESLMDTKNVATKYHFSNILFNSNISYDYYNDDDNAYDDINNGSNYIHKKFIYNSPYESIEKKFNKIKSINEFIEQGYPMEIDWSKQNVTTQIHSQGICGSCYAHSVIEMIETAVAIKLNLSEPISLSVQQMIDCADHDKNYGCEGGDNCFLLQWLKNYNISILPEKIYNSLNYISKCRILPGQIKMENLKAVKVKNYQCLNFVDYEFELLSLIATKGPVAASVNGIPWMNYLGGIIKYHCNGPSNHAIQIIGYNLNCDEPYYIIRNSWGVNFGINGYAKILFGHNICNIATEISTADIELV